MGDTIQYTNKSKFTYFFVSKLGIGICMGDMRNLVNVMSCIYSISHLKTHIKPLVPVKTQEIFRRKLEQELSAKFKAKINKSIERERLWCCRLLLVELRSWYRVPIYICSVSGVPTRT